MTPWRVGVFPGDGVVIRIDRTIVVVGSATARPTMIDQLKDTIASHVDDELVRRLARLVLAEDEPPPLAVASLDDGDVAVFLHGDVELRWPGGHVTGTDHILGVTATVAAVDGFTIALSGVADLAVESWNDLGAGTLPGGGVSVDAPDDARDGGSGRHPSTADEAPRTEPTPVVDAGDDAPAEESGDAADSGDDDPADADAADDAPFEAIAFTGAVDLSDRAPLPIALGDVVDDDDRPPYERTVAVIGVYSPRGFFNHPDAKYCSRTGVKMGASMTKVLTEGPRPPLGVLTLDDGSTMTIRWNTVIGRDPTVDELVRSGLAAPFIVSDIAQSVSRRHALLELVDWDVFISDLGSRNHTYLQAGPAEPLRQLTVGERVALHSGTIVHIGKRSFVYNEHHVR